MTDKKQICANNIVTIDKMQIRANNIVDDW